MTEHRDPEMSTRLREAELSKAPSRCHGDLRCSFLEPVSEISGASTLCCDLWGGPGGGRCVAIVRRVRQCKGSAAISMPCSATGRPFCGRLPPIGFLHTSGVQSDAPNPPPPPAAAELAVLLRRHRHQGSAEIMLLSPQLQDDLIMTICGSSFAGNIRTSFLDWTA